jgi:hypothetical protein
MWYEKREIYVTARCRENEVLKITAAIGNRTSCKPTDNIDSRLVHAKRLLCDTARLYHNHPNTPSPSPPDKKHLFYHKEYFSRNGILYKGYIVFWNLIFEYRILEFDENGRTLNLRAYDVSQQKLISIT